MTYGLGRSCHGIWLARSWKLSITFGSIFSLLTRNHLGWKMFLGVLQVKRAWNKLWQLVYRTRALQEHLCTILISCWHYVFNLKTKFYLKAGDLINDTMTANETATTKIFDQLRKPSNLYHYSSEWVLHILQRWRTIIHVIQGRTLVYVLSLVSMLRSWCTYFLGLSRQCHVAKLRFEGREPYNYTTSTSFNLKQVSCENYSKF